MKILGIDVGLAIVGFGVVEKQGTKYTHIEHGTITTLKGVDNSIRLTQVYDQLLLLLDRIRPDIVGVEQLFFFRNATTIITVGQARGVILLALEQRGYQIVEVTPLQVKQFVSSYGRADKHQVQNMVKFLLKLESIPKPDDAADALAIAICAANMNKIKVPLIKKSK